MNTKKSDNNSFLAGVSIFILVILLLVAYGFYDKYTKEKFYGDFKANKIVMCGNIQVQRSRGWRIHNNKFFTNGTIMKTIIFCKSVN